ncbi:hypothetical protein HPY42_04360 [Coprothermobacteraceae bacterium]|nr:hypothetical protein [Coprothermobacteraceae bacterium]
MKTLIGIELSVSSSRYYVEHRTYPNPDTPQKHIVVLSRNQQLGRLVANELEQCTDMDCVYGVSDRLNDEGTWLALVINARDLVVINNSDMVLYHEQAGKTTCLTDPLFDFTHRLTWQSQEDAVVRTVSRGVLNLDDVLRIEENGLNLGKVVVRYLEDLYDGDEETQRESTPANVEPLKSRWVFTLLAAIIVLSALGLIAGYTQARWRDLITRNEPNNNTHTTTTATSIALPLAKTVTVADLDGVTGKWLLVNQGKWYVSDGKYLYSESGKSSLGEAKGLYAGRLWHINATWYLEYKDGMIHLSSTRGNRVSLAGSGRTDFDALIDFTATSNGQSATVYVLMPTEVRVYEGVNFLSLKRTLPLPQGYKAVMVTKRLPFRFLVGDGQEAKLMTIENGQLKDLGSSDGTMAMTVGTEVYTIQGNIIRTQAKDYQLPFGVERISAIDDSFVLLQQPALLVEIRI